MGIVSDEYTAEYVKAAHDVIDHDPLSDPAKSKRVRNFRMIENPFLTAHGSHFTVACFQMCKSCDVLKLQLSKNSISLHCLIG